MYARLKIIPANIGEAYAIIYGDLKTMALLTIATAMVAFIVSYIFLPRADWLVFWIVLVATVGTRIIDYSAAVLRSLDKFLTETQVALTSFVLQFSLVVAAGLIFRSLLAVAIALLCSRTLIALLAVFTISRQTEIRSKQGEEVNSVPPYAEKCGFAYAADSTVAIFLQQIDILVISALTDRTSVGIYGAGSRLVQLMLAVPWVVTNISVPAIERSKTPTERGRHLNQLKLVLSGTGAMGAIGLMVFGPLFTYYILGEAFFALNALWPIFAVLVLARFLEAYTGILMLVDDQVVQRALMQTRRPHVTIMVVGFLLVPHYNVSGMVATIGLTALMSSLYFGHKLSDKALPPRQAILLVSAALAVGFVALL